MGFLFDLLSLPVSGPLKGVLWIAETLAERADDELYNPDQIRGKLVELELRLDLNEISESEYEVAETELLERLKIARQRLAERGGVA